MSTTTSKTTPVVVIRSHDLLFCESDTLGECSLQEASHVLERNIAEKYQLPRDTVANKISRVSVLKEVLASTSHSPNPDSSTPIPIKELDGDTGNVLFVLEMDSTFPAIGREKELETELRTVKERMEAELDKARQEINRLKADQTEMWKKCLALNLGSCQDLAWIKIRHLLNHVQGRLAYVANPRRGGPDERKGSAAWHKLCASFGSDVQTRVTSAIQALEANDEAIGGLIDTGALSILVEDSDLRDQGNKVAHPPEPFSQDNAEVYHLAVDVAVNDEDQKTKLKACIAYLLSPIPVLLPSPKP